MLNICSKSIQLWLVHEKDIIDQHLLDHYHGLLDERELRRYDRLRLVRDKKQFLITQVLARTVLASLVGEHDPGAIRFERNPYGKPFLPNSNQPRFNLTNSNGLVVLAVTADVEVGIDVEYTMRKAACLQLARRYFAEDEAATFVELEEAALRDRFFDYWTLKEAWLKAYGTGLRTPLNHFGFTLSEKVEISFTPNLRASPDEWTFWQFDIREAFRLSVCVNDEPDSDYTISAVEGIPGQGFSPIELVQRRPA